MQCVKFLHVIRFMQTTHLLSHLNCLYLCFAESACLHLQDPSAVALGATDANAIALPSPPSMSAPAPGVSYTPAAAFSGVKQGMVFKTGLQGIGYYPDMGLQSSAAQTPAVTASTGMGLVPSGQLDTLFHCPDLQNCICDDGLIERPATEAVQFVQPPDACDVTVVPRNIMCVVMVVACKLGICVACFAGAIKAGQAREGWTGMRTVAQLRRELGVGPPRDLDSLYKPIERAPRKFNPLKIPKTLQAQLPFKTKVMNFPSRKRETLEQKRAIKVREPGEKRADALVHALSAIRNVKTQKRREQQTRRREVMLYHVSTCLSHKMFFNMLISNSQAGCPINTTEQLCCALFSVPDLAALSISLEQVQATCVYWLCGNALHSL